MRAMRAVVRLFHLLVADRECARPAFLRRRTRLRVMFLDRLFARWTAYRRWVGGSWFRLPPGRPCHRDEALWAEHQGLGPTLAEPCELWESWRRLPVARALPSSLRSAPAPDPHRDVSGGFVDELQRGGASRRLIGLLRPGRRPGGPR